MSNARNIGDSAPVINFLDNVTSDIQTQLNTLDTAIGNVSVTSGSLTKTFAADETATITLSGNVLAPVVTATKEVAQTGVTNNHWDAAAASYTFENSATATTLTPSAVGDGTFTLGSGSFTSDDVGKTISGNGGVAVLTSASGDYKVSTNFTNTNAIASGDWTMYALVYDSTADVLKPSGVSGAGYDISVANYTGQNIASNQNKGIAFNNDGTKFYNLQAAGGIHSLFNEWNLSTAYDVSTASYVTQLSLFPQDTVGQDICFNSDGTKLYYVGSNNDRIYLYNLTTAFDLTTASYSSTYKDVSGTTGIPTGIKWSTDGTKFFLAEQNYSYIYQYNASTAFDITTLGSPVTSLDLTAKETATEGVAISSDGTKLFIIGQSSDKVHEYSLPTPYSLTSAAFVQSFDVSSQTNAPTGIIFKSDGSEMWVCSEATGVYNYTTQSVTTVTGYQPAISSTIDSTYWTDLNSMTATNAVGDGNAFYAISADGKTSWNILDNSSGVRKIVKNNGGTYQVNTNSTYGSETWANAATNTEVAALRESMTSASSVSSQYDVSTATFVDYFSVSAVGANSAYGFCFSATGHKMYVTSISLKSILEYDLSTNFDVSTASYTATFGVVAQDNSPADVQFNNDGTKMYVVGDSNNSVYEYALSTAYDVTSATLSSTFSIATYETDPWGLAFNSDGTKMFTIGVYGLVVEWALSTGFDISTTSYTRNFSTGSQLTYATGVEFNSDGTKMYVIDNGAQDVLTYTLTTGFDISTASFTARFLVTRGGLSKVRFNNDGSKMFLLNYSYEDVGEYTIGTTNYVNQMTGTELNAINDASQITLGTALDLAAIIYYASGSSTPSYSGSAINYDANVLNQGAQLGVDYTYDAPAQNKVRITSVNSANLKIRVV